MILALVGGKNVTERISTLQIRQRLGDILNRVALRNDQFIIERKGKPLAAMVPVERLGQMQQAARLHILSILERQPGALSQAEADRIATEAKHRTRRRRRK
jgi:PHD/YefM family antitoxin component YafN of YafNO toxin-antitoxin module